jgi:hypothetical protein
VTTTGSPAPRTATFCISNRTRDFLIVNNKHFNFAGKGMFTKLVLHIYNTGRHSRWSLCDSHDDCTRGEHRVSAGDDVVPEIGMILYSIQTILYSTILTV